MSESLRRVYLEDNIIVGLEGIVLGSGSGNGVDVSFFTPQRFASERLILKRTELGFQASDFLIVTIGRICRDKGIEEISKVAEALSSYKKIRFILIGSIDDEYSKNILDNIIVNHQVKHLGYIDDIPSILGIADVHLFLSHREGFGNVAIEAAAMGVWTIGYDVVGLKDSISLGVSGSRHALRSVAPVVNEILDLYNNSGEASNIAPCAIGWARSNFGNHAVWKNYANFYKGQF